MSDDFDNLPPIEEESDDFAHFDPENYLRRRGRIYGEPELIDSSEDPLPPPRGRRRRGVPSSGSYEPQYTTGRRRGRRSTSRRRGSVLDDRDEFDAGDAPLGIGAAILGLLHEGNIGFFTEILGGLGPLARFVLPAIGCVLVLACIAVCGGGYILITTLTRR